MTAAAGEAAIVEMGATVEEGEGQLEDGGLAGGRRRWRRAGAGAEVLVQW